MLVSKKTWCPWCKNPTIIRTERTIRTIGGWPKLFMIIYKCTTDGCAREDIIKIKVNKKIKKRILDRERRSTDRTPGYEPGNVGAIPAAPTKGEENNKI